MGIRWGLPGYIPMDVDTIFHSFIHSSLNDNIEHLNCRLEIMEVMKKNSISSGLFLLVLILCLMVTAFE